MRSIKEWWSKNILRIKSNPDEDNFDYENPNNYEVEEESPLLNEEDSYNKKVHIPLKQKIRTRFHYYIPIFSWLPKYNPKKQIVGDIVAGLGVGAMLIPQCLAYASLAKLSPIYGLYTSWMPLLSYVILGTSKQLSYGPDALSSLLTGISVDKPENKGIPPEQVATMLSFVAGVFLFLIGLFRVGFLDNILSRALLCGFVNAIGLTILFEQLQPLFGLEDKGHGWKKVIYWIKDIKHMNWLTLGIGFVTIWIIMVIKFGKKKFKWVKFIPETLVVVVIGIIVSKFAGFEGKTAILGKIPQGIKAPSAPNFKMDNIGGLIADGILIGIVGFVEHIAIGKIYASKHNYQVSPNRELVAVGISNLTGSFFNAYPTFGSLARSSVADAMGATSQIFTVVIYLMILLTILVGGPLFYYLPKAVMTGIIITAAIGLFEAHDIIFLFRIRAWKELIQAFLTFVFTIFLGVELGLIVSLMVSIFFIIKHTTYPQIILLGRVPETGQYRDVTQNDTETFPGIMIVKIDDPLYFANIGQIKSLFSRIEKLGDPKAHPAESRIDNSPLKAIIIHASNVPSMDAASIQILSEMIEDYKKRDVVVCWVKLKKQLKVAFERSGVIPNFGDMVFSSTQEAVNYVNECYTTDDESRDSMNRRKSYTNDILDITEEI